LTAHRRLDSREMTQIALTFADRVNCARHENQRNYKMLNTKAFLNDGIRNFGIGLSGV